MVVTRATGQQNSDQCRCHKGLRNGHYRQPEQTEKLTPVPPKAPHDLLEGVTPAVRQELLPA
eukprot:CAMPEP_0172874716 /NCGR_PEP_ID=MMETSP1075-20121228/99178_1 /TAXON_ID=2916 /ORGANISM="Ceratium fusus, Strain PA161109" /LENGTH=61 /DNA_ID=CAMNT_0013725599 /DNA_START=555 /DNA_END=737 /DNA_ORIENTATION=-